MSIDHCACNDDNKIIHKVWDVPRSGVLTLITDHILGINLTTIKEEFAFHIHMLIIKPIFHMPLKKIMYAGIYLKVKEKHTT
jgi:hypothetical protein